MISITKVAVCVILVMMMLTVFAKNSVSAVNSVSDTALDTALDTAIETTLDSSLDTTVDAEKMVISIDTIDTAATQSPSAPPVATHVATHAPTQAHSTQAHSTQAHSTQAHSTQAHSTQAHSTQAPSTHGPLETFESWNADSPTIQKLKTYLDAVLPSIPNDQRIATFDCDGTIMVEKPTYVETLLSHYALCEHGVGHRGPNYAAICAKDPFHLSELTAVQVDELLLHTFANWTAREFNEYVQYFVTRVDGCFVAGSKRPCVKLLYQPMLEIIRSLVLDNHFQVYIVTASQQYVVRGLIDAVFHDDEQLLQNVKVIGTTVKHVLTFQGHPHRLPTVGNIHWKAEQGIDCPECIDILFSKSTSQMKGQWNEQPDQQLKQQMDQQLKQQVNQQLKQQMDEKMNQQMSQQVNEKMNEQENEQVNHQVNESRVNGNGFNSRPRHEPRGKATYTVEFIRKSEYEIGVYKEVKVQEIYRFTPHPPLISFGNDYNDVATFYYSMSNNHPSFCGLVHHNDAEREYEYDRLTNTTLGEEVKKWGWNVIRMKEEWKWIY